MIDEKDRRILEILKEDARKTVREIAKSTKIRPSTVHQRIQKMKENGIIENFTVRLNHKAVEENFVVFMLVTTNKDIDDMFLKSPHVKEVHGVTGEFDLLLKLRFKDVEEFNSFLIGFRKDSRIGKTLTMVGTIELKEKL